MARKRAGQLIWTRSGWSARVTVEVDGESIRKCYPLGTDDKTAARAKLARLIEQIKAGNAPTPEETRRQETFAEAAKRVVEKQRDDGMHTWEERKSRLDRLALPEIGDMQVGAIRTRHVRAVLEAAAGKGLSRQTVVHLRNDLSAVLGALWRDEVIAENPVKRAELPKSVKSTGAGARSSRTTSSRS